MKSFNSQLSPGIPMCSVVFIFLTIMTIHNRGGVESLHPSLVYWDTIARHVGPHVENIHAADQHVRPFK